MLLGLVLYSAAYIAETLRAAVEALPRASASPRWRWA
jgi:ABC-type amino acid transport system permease subunit